MAVPNFPTKPGFGDSGRGKSFPKDLINGSREFYTSISFVKYNSPLNTNLLGQGLEPAGQVILPIPKKLNDNEVILWEEWSGKDALAGAASMAGNFAGRLSSSLVAGAAAVGGPLVSIETGLQINPYQFMMFKRPMFKEHTLTWTLAPNSQEESDDLRDIIKQCKRAALPPSIGYSNPIIEYPKLAQVSFKPAGYLYKLKPCVIVAVQVDYTAGGQPSFFKSGAPTIVNLTLQLKEYELQSEQDI